jgi:iron complex outermembrane recepter protein
MTNVWTISMENETTARTARLRSIRRRKATLLCCTALTLMPAVSLAQDTGAGDVTLLDRVALEAAANPVGPDDGVVAERTTVGSKTDTPILDVPASVSVVTEAEMEKRGVHDLDEAMAYTSSVSTDIYGSDDRYDFYLIRGFYQGAYGTYRDGLPIRIWNFTGNRLEPFGMQRIEVLKGSTSTLFGLNSPGGLVNAISKRPQPTKFGEVYTTMGDGHLETGFDFGAPIDAAGDWTYRLTGKWQEGDNGPDFTRDDRIYIAPSLTWTPTDATSLTLLGDYQKRKGNTSHGVPYGSGLDPDTLLGEPDYDNMNTVEWNLGYQFEHDFGNGLQVRSNARYSKLDLTYESVFPGATGTSSSDSTISRESLAVYGKSSSFTIDNQLQYDTSRGIFDSRTLVGADYAHYDIREDREDGTAAEISLYDPSYCGRGCVTPWRGIRNDTDLSIYGIYLQEELTIGDRWIATAGGRYDHVSQTDDYVYDYDSYGVYTGVYEGSDEATDEAFTKRFGLTFKATDQISVYANYSESFQPIGVSRAYLTEAAKLQRGTQYEAGVKFAPKEIDALFTLALFDLTQTNVSQWNASYTAQYQIGEVNVRGVEMEGKVALTSRVNATLAYSYWNAQIKDDVLGNTGNRPQLVPEHIASAWLDYTIPGQGKFGDLTLGLGVRYVGSRYADNANTIELGAQTTVDAAISYKITDSTALSVNATNLFDKRYVTHVDTYSNTAYYGNGRSILATLKHTW